MAHFMRIKGESAGVIYAEGQMPKNHGGIALAEQ